MNKRDQDNLAKLYLENNNPVQDLFSKHPVNTMDDLINNIRLMSTHNPENAETVVYHAVQQNLISLKMFSDLLVNIYGNNLISAVQNYVRDNEEEPESYYR